MPNVTPLRPLKVLLVEDNPGDARLLGPMLSGTEEYHFDVSHAWCLDEAISLMASRFFDAVLLDLELPDSHGMASLDAVRKRDRRRQSAVIVVTGDQNPDRALEAMRHGAQDFLNKDDLNATALSRAIRFAVERVHLQSRSEVAEAERCQFREAEVLKNMGSRAPVRPGRLVQATQRLSRASPKIFATLTDSYCTLVEETIAQDGACDSHAVSTGVEALTGHLIDINARPRDVADLHRACLTRLLPKEGTAPGRIEEEARLLLIEIMAGLAGSYRDDLLESCERGAAPDEESGRGSA